MILKVVNAGSLPQATTVRLRGVQQVAPIAQAIVLTSASPKDENSFDEPTKVAPTTGTVPAVAAEFHHTFPANSVTVLRVNAN